ncbi:Os07g0542900 [Oryza sativa Japonica Group]|uniref:Os07g0542900 protein n=1 Tax=Oryza sativa subsp. japonica TaxID=39947 RepID=Q0D5Q5_ORYSJ|nr:Os07g0542900 [Oryza sativa Japonica Group]|eukprot:NP_001059904.2 Os07g0542900 [Oryza sativa Japonica Group]
MAVAAVASTAVAKDYTVGGSYGWDTYVDYDKWAAGKTFIVGDTINQQWRAAFKYEPYHNVVEVPAETDYDGCVSTNPVSVHSGGNTTFELAAAGTRYFICSIPRHCLNGTMHVKVTTVPYSASAAAAAAADAGPSPAPLPSPPADEQQHRSNSASSPAAGPSSSAASTPRHRKQPAVAVAGLALAALVAMAA